MNLIWLPRALKNRNEQLTYVASESRQAAVDLGDRIAEQALQLVDFPDIGRIGRVRGTRELVIGRTPFILVYRVKRQARLVEILRLLHGAQQYPKS